MFKCPSKNDKISIKCQFDIKNFNLLFNYKSLLFLIKERFRVRLKFYKILYKCFFYSLIKTEEIIIIIIIIVFFSLFPQFKFLKRYFNMSNQIHLLSCIHIFDSIQFIYLAKCYLFQMRSYSWKINNPKAI